MLTAHRWLGTWQRSVDAYIAMTEFAREKFIAGGLPVEKIALKPNFCATDPGIGNGAGGYALFVGRLSPEKGVETLMAAWRRLGGTVPVYVVGDGPPRRSWRNSPGKPSAATGSGGNRRRRSSL